MPFRTHDEAVPSAAYGDAAWAEAKEFIKRADGGLVLRYGREIVEISPADTDRLRRLLNDPDRRM